MFFNGRTVIVRGAAYDRRMNRGEEKMAIHDVVVDGLELSPDSTRIQACTPVSEPPR